MKGNFRIKVITEDYVKALSENFIKRNGVLQRDEIETLRDLAEALEKFTQIAEARLEFNSLKNMYEKNSKE